MTRIDHGCVGVVREIEPSCVLFVVSVASVGAGARRSRLGALGVRARPDDARRRPTCEPPTHTSTCKRETVTDRLFLGMCGVYAHQTTTDRVEGVWYVP